MTHRIPAPSDHDRRRLLERIRSLSLRRGRFVLSSGAVSDYYLDLRLTTTDPEGAYLTARFLLHEAARLGATLVGGPTLGADPMVGATVAHSFGTTWPVGGFLVRSAAKDHGTGKQVEGHLSAGAKVLILDDVVTSAGSLVSAADAVLALGGEIAGSFCLVDRAAGGREKLEARGWPLSAVFHVDEVLRQEPSEGGSAAMPRPRTPLLTADAILELVPGHVLLVERRFPPLGWALPGGFVEENETLEEAVVREIAEETSLEISRAVQLHTYSGPGRDARFPTTTTVFVAVAHGEFAAGDDAAGARLFPLDDLPGNICFDHRSILEDFRAGRYGIRPGHLH